MSLRITQRTMYNQFVSQMQTNLGAYMESNIQGSSQKKINRPSDDPAGMALALNYRNAISDTQQLQRNVDTALGWLNLADSTLNQVSTAVIGIKTLAEQASTSTMSPENRREIATQVREYFGQLLNLSNTEFEGKSIFAGHKYTQNAFEEGLGMSCMDADFTGNSQYSITGSSKSTIMARFPQDGEIPPPPGSGGLEYTWSADSGKTWQTATLAEGESTLVMNGVRLTITPKLDAGGNPLPVNVKAFTPDDENTEASSHNGTVLYLRPTAYYQGDDNDPPPAIESSPPFTGNQAAEGAFGGKTLIRVDDAANPADMKYSYSTDNGASWIQARADASGPVTRFIVPGGYLDVDTPVAPATFDDGQRFAIRPHEADLGYEIMKGAYIAVNSVGKDIFGGIYQGEAALGGAPQNLFEVVGALIGFCETNNQEGIQQCFAALEDAHKVVLNEAARIGGLENRLGLAKDVLSFQKLDQQERLSYTEDVDLTELLTRMAQQQLAYNTVLKSSSMIMQLNLTKFV